MREESTNQEKCSHDLKEKKMKVLFLTSIPSPYRVDFFNELSKYCDLTVIFDSKKAPERDEKWKSSEEIQFKAVFLSGIRIRNRLVYSAPLRVLLKEEWDIVVLGVYMTTTAAYVNFHYKKPFYIEADGGFVKSDAPIIRKIKTMLISRASGWFSSGLMTDQYLINYGANKNKIFHFPFSSIREKDILIYSKDMQVNKKNAKKKIGIEDGKKAVLTVGQFIHRKGFDVLIKAASKANEMIDYYIVGGKTTNEYSDLCKKLNLTNVHFVEFKTKEELKTYYVAADLFVLPTREDIWGLVINEAFAYGLPIITTNRCIAGLEMIEDGQNGFIVPVDDEVHLASAIDRIISDKQLSEKMVQNNIIKSHQYTIETMAEAHKVIFERIVGNTNE